MEKSKIYNLLEVGLLRKWIDKIEEEESNNWFFINEEQSYIELEKTLNKKEKKMLALYSNAAVDKMHHIYWHINNKVLNYGIKMGMELQDAFSEDDD